MVTFNKYLCVEMPLILISTEKENVREIPVQRLPTWTFECELLLTICQFHGGDYCDVYEDAEVKTIYEKDESLALFAAIC